MKDEFNTITKINQRRRYPQGWEDEVMKSWGKKKPRCLYCEFVAKPNS